MRRIRRGAGAAVLDRSAALCPPLLVDHVDRAVGGKNSTFLPGADLAEVLPGKVEWPVRRIEQRVIAVLARAVARGDPEAVGHLRPGHGHRLLQLPAMARVQAFDRG